MKKLALALMGISFASIASASSVNTLVALSNGLAYSVDFQGYDRVTQAPVGSSTVPGTISGINTATLQVSGVSGPGFYVKACINFTTQCFFSPTCKNPFSASIFTDRKGKIKFECINTSKKY